METNRQGKYVIEMRKKYEEKIKRLNSQIGDLLLDKIHLMRLLEDLRNDGLVEFWYTNVDGKDYRCYKYGGREYFI